MVRYHNQILTYITYFRVDAHWRAQRSNTGDLRYVTLISIGGGDKDMQVSSSVFSIGRVRDWRNIIINKFVSSKMLQYIKMMRFALTESIYLYGTQVIGRHNGDFQVHGAIWSKLTSKMNTTISVNDIHRFTQLVLDPNINLQTFNPLMYLLF